MRKLGRRYQRRLVKRARAEDQPTLQSLLVAHLGAQVDAEVDALDVVEESWPGYDHVNVQLGIDAWLGEPGRSHTLLGMRRFRHTSFGLGDLLREADTEEDYGPWLGNPSWTTLPTGPDGRVAKALRAGIYLVDDAGRGRAAMLLIGGGDPEEGHGGVELHVVAERPGTASAIAAEVRELALRHNVYRGQLISFDRAMFGERASALQFHTRPRLSPADVILPEETLRAVHRQVVGVAEHRDVLRAAGQHLKRGLLLYGPPGVGKTHTVRYLSGELRDFTILLLTGSSLGLISTAASVARTLQPAMIVVEDVDLIAEDRGMFGGNHPLLFQLLNEMDGLAEDADVVFLLTTNRPDVLEPALAARPGRVDQAVELELPDTGARRRLIELYRGPMDLDTSRLDEVLAQTDGVTASFLKELLRRAALSASADMPRGDGRLAVTSEHLQAALDELMDTRSAMTRVLLGAAGTGTDH